MLIFKHILSVMNLDKPLVIFDLETTGLALAYDRIIELAFVKIMPNGRVIEKDIFFNPEIDVPSEVTAINGLTNADLADKPLFRDHAQEIWDIFYDCYYGGFNVVNFDLPMLRREFLRAGYDFNYTKKQVIDSKVIYHAMEPRDLAAAYKYYCQKELANAHSALADVRASAEILDQQLAKYDYGLIRQISEAPDDRYVDEEKRFYWRSGEAYLNFSKYKDRSLAEIAKVDPGFLRWMMEADFSPETKQIVERALEGEFPKKQSQDSTSSNDIVAPAKKSMSGFVEEPKLF
ncbi:MAG TPA: 3'-5' exonuclease [Patescibacteria group bacterium]|nr:3'-5' exonuclease [bacterium]HRT11383.1 3'-5' exonuclease [Patescibacteria group bacterium]HRU90176.1 3'-5' exonuclease [Patescibacteria group bacterium]